MKEAHKKFIKVFAALLPAASMLRSFADAFWFATLLGAGALFVTHLFILLGPLFPKKLFRAAVVIFLAVFFQIIQSLTHPAPFWVVSLALLLDWNDFDAKHLGQRPLPPLVRTGIFWCGALLIGTVHQLLTQRGILAFEQPAGVFVTLAFFSAFILAAEKPLAPLWLKKRGDA